jgi:hypothetical protein
MYTFISNFCKIFIKINLPMFKVLSPLILPTISIRLSSNQKLLQAIINKFLLTNSFYKFFKLNILFAKNSLLILQVPRKAKIFNDLS